MFRNACLERFLPGASTSDYSYLSSPTGVANPASQQRPITSSVNFPNEHLESMEPSVQDPVSKSAHARQFSATSVSSVDHDISRRSELGRGEPYSQSIIDETVPFGVMNPDAQGSVLSIDWEPCAQGEGPRDKLRVESQVVPGFLIDELAPPAMGTDPYPSRQSPTSALSVDSDEIIDPMLDTHHDSSSTQPMTTNPSRLPSKLPSLSILVPTRSRSTKRVLSSSSSFPTALSPVNHGLRKQRSLAPLTPTSGLLEVEHPTPRHPSSVGTSPSPREKRFLSITHRSTDATHIQRGLTSPSSASISINGLVEGSTTSTSSSRPLSPASITSTDVDGLPIH